MDCRFAAQQIPEHQSIFTAVPFLLIRHSSYYSTFNSLIRLQTMDIEDGNNTPKPSLNRQVLERHGITYSEDVRVDQALLGLPEHVALLAEFLLDFEGLLEISSRPVLENEFRNHTGNARPPHTYGPPAESTYFQAHDVNTRRSERNKAIDEAELKQKSLIAEGARWLEDNQKSEDDWVFYLRVNIFKAFEQHQETSSEPSRYR